MNGTKVGDEETANRCLCLSAFRPYYSRLGWRKGRQETPGAWLCSSGDFPVTLEAI